MQLGDLTLTLLARIARQLEQNGISFALIGAAAMAAHGVSRSTYDTDLFAIGGAALDPELWRALQGDGIDVDVRHGDDDDPLLGVVRFVDDEQTIDLVVGRSPWQRGILDRATPTRVFSLDLPIVTLEDLIVLKLYAGGTQDRWDIQQLLASTGEISLVDVDSRVQTLPDRCQALWRTLRPV